MNIPHKILAAGFLLAAGTGMAQAQLIAGSLSFETGAVSAFNQSNNPVNSLALTDKFTFGLIPFLGANSFISGTSDDFNAIPLYTPVSQSQLDLMNLTAFNWSSNFGSFQAAPIVIGSTTYHPYATLHQNSLGQKVLNVYEYGNFMPSGLLSGYSGNQMEETISLTQTGAGTSISCSATALAATPEPAPLLTLGAASIGLFLRRKRTQAQ